MDYPREAAYPQWLRGLLKLRRTWWGLMAQGFLKKRAQFSKDICAAQEKFSSNPALVAALPQVNVTGASIENSPPTSADPRAVKNHEASTNVSLQR
ncbi:unnamed protein product, partial [Mesorhabditis belari]|uniref:Uncharacterized protein n=1 Tax=Mesorhabditis belari TaxID=2138241 RepID=A0AAF3EHE9_9BILA